MVNPAASNCETEVIAAGASVIEHPVAFEAVKVPAIIGAVVSLIVIVCVFEVKLPQISVNV